MKIKCDVCDKEEALVFCIADEASLCSDCDHRVHHANKLAFKHLRFSLLHPSSPPLCDICQEKRAFLFCQQDRAILCKDCDSSIHAASEYTKKHDRFFLTGVKLSSNSCPYKSPPVSPPSSANQERSVPVSSTPKPPIKKPASAHLTNSKVHSSLLIPRSQIEKPAKTMPTKSSCDDAVVVNQSDGTSTISEYLIDMLPGWHVEDFLDPSVHPLGFNKNDGKMPSYMEAQVNNNNSNNNYQRSFGSLPEENLGIWVPQIPQSLPSSYPNRYHSHEINNTQIGMNKEADCSYPPTPNMKQQEKYKRSFDDGGFTVPQITLPVHNNKKFRSFW